MPRTTSRTRRSTSTKELVVISPPTMTMPRVTKVSQATRPIGSSLRTASRTASEIWSQTLSGCPSVTDSEVKKYLPFFCMVWVLPHGRLLAQVKDGGLVDGDVFLDVAVGAEDAVRKRHTLSDGDVVEEYTIFEDGVRGDPGAVPDDGVRPDLGSRLDDGAFPDETGGF